LLAPFLRLAKGQTGNLAFAHALDGDRFADAVMGAENADKAIKAAQKTTKYLLRQLDAARYSGVHLGKTVPKRLRRFVEAVPQLERVRNNPKAFQEVLDRLKLTPQEYVENSLALANEVMRHVDQNSAFRQFGSKLAAEHES